VDGHLFGNSLPDRFRWLPLSTPGYVFYRVCTFWRFLTATVVFGLMLPFVKGVRLPG